MSDLKKLSENFLKAAEELEKAAAHCRIASKRYMAHDVPSGCAHAFAIIGHISKANTLVVVNSEIHSDHAQINE